MIILKREDEIRRYISEQKQQGRYVGFVPTMGALHKGHLSLAEASLANGDITVVSIFVNPKQFNDPEDLKKYPRPIDADINMLEESGVHLLFLPDDIDIYPPGLDTSIPFDPGPAADVMEGKFRPGHFKGMAEVVHRLLSIVAPHKLYMGQKDFQQLAIVRKMITDMHMPVILEMCPTVREENGLAMSSRNVRLSKEAREEAGIIYQTLVSSQQMYEEGVDIEEIKLIAMDALSEPGFDPEYFEIVDGITFEQVHTNQDSQFVVACCAVKVEGVRLIDNTIWVRPE